MTVKQFRDTELTNTGFSVSNKAALGKTQYSTTRAVTTDVDLSSYKTDDLKNLTSLPNEINSGIITDYDMPGNNVSAIKINFNNSNFKDGYVVRAVGMYAKENGSDKEFLHSITVSDSPVYIPAVSGNVFDGFYLTMAIFTGNNKNINIKIADETNATVKYVDDAVSKVANVANNATPSDTFNKYVTSNNNVIDKLDDEVKSNATNIATLQSSVASNSNEISSNASLVNQTTTQINANVGSLQSQVNNLNSIVQKTAHNWSNFNSWQDILNVPDGYYEVAPTSIIPGWGLLHKTSWLDTFLTFHDMFGNDLYTATMRANDASQIRPFKKVGGDNDDFKYRGSYNGSLANLIARGQNGWVSVNEIDLQCGAVPNWDGWGIIEMQFDDYFGNSNCHITIKEHGIQWTAEGLLNNDKTAFSYFTGFRQLSQY